MKKVLYIISLFVLFFVGINNCNAASISVSSNSSNVVVGNTVKVTVTVSSDVAAWDFTIGYDSNKLRATSSLDSGMHAASISSLHSRSYTLTFKAIASGSANVYVSDAALYDDNGSSLGVSKGSKTFTIKTQAEIEASYSKNNYLSNLSVDGVDLSPSFNKDTLEYSVSLDPETKSINVNAIVADSTASVAGTGSHEVTEGDNNIQIVVTAQNGTTRIYTIVANVKEYDPIKVKIDGKEYTVVRKKDDIKAPDGYEETTVTINGEEVPAYKSKVTKYTLVALKDSKGNQNLYIYEKDKYTLYKEYTFNKVILYPIELSTKDIPKGYKKFKITYNDEKIVAYKLNKSSNYALIYGLNVETGKEHLYMYDSNEDTLQIYNDEETKILNEKLDLYLKVILGGSVLIVILLFIIIMMLVKNRKTKKKNKIRKTKIENNDITKEIKF